MAVRDILKMGHPALDRVAARVADPAAPWVREAVTDMIDTMRAAPGIGLAAPQIGIDARLVVLTVPAGRMDPATAPPAWRDGVPLTVLINPEIVPLAPDMAEDWEACLSVPGLMGRVPRHTRIRYAAQTLDGPPIDRIAEGYHARVVQHECDHLDGWLYPRRMADVRQLIYQSEIAHRVPAAPDVERTPS